jgi:bacterioferritin (cytochrome b1)
VPTKTSRTNNQFEIDVDPTTRRLMARILEQEEEHADDLNDLLGN